MIPVLVSLLTILRDSLRSRAALQAEILALRHQLLVLQRRNQKQRLRLSAFDRLLWVGLSRIWREWRAALHGDELSPTAEATRMPFGFMFTGCCVKPGS